MKRFWFLTVTAALALTSCDNSRVFEATSPIDEKGWDKLVKVPFEAEITDTNRVYNLQFDLRIDDDYPYSNMYVLLRQTTPDSVRSMEMLHFTLADDAGKWLGKGLGDIHTYRLPAKQNMRFHRLGKIQV